MKKISLIVLFTITATLALFALSAPGFAVDTPVKKVKSEGSSRSVEGVTDIEVKNHAIETALQNAVMDIFDSVSGFEPTREKTGATSSVAIRKGMTSAEIAASGVSLREAVSLSSLSYVLDYRIISEGWLTHLDVDPTTLPPPPYMPGTEEEGAGTEVVPTPIEGEGVEGAQTLEDEEALEEEAELIESSVRLYHVWVEASIDIVRLRKTALRLSVSSTGNIEETSFVSIILVDVMDYNNFDAVKNALNAIDIVKGFSADAFLRGRIEITAEVWGNPHELIERLNDSDAISGLSLLPGGPQSILIRGKGKNN